MSFDKLLSRLAGKVDSGVMDLITDIKNQPLMVAPNMVDGYLRDALIKGKMGDTKTVNGSYSSVPAKIFGEINTGVIDVSGGMTARAVSVPCAKSPASYAEIKSTMQTMINAEVDFIVARFNSGGGVASQMTILSRWIKEQRPQTRLIACIDDHAYSAAYGIASAFDTIYVTETSGAGSVGVVLRTENNIKTEGDVEYIYAGKKKVDGAMDQPLSDSARKDYQTEVDRLYGLFTELVSDNLNIELEKVTKTEAGTFHGKDIIDVGFAHKMGTFDDVINNIYSGEEMNLKEIEDANARIELQQSKLDQAKLKVNNAQAELDAKNDQAKLDAGGAKVDETETEIAAKAKIKADAEAEIAELAETKAKVKADADAKLEADNEIRNICLVAGLSTARADSFIAHGFAVSEVSSLVADMTSSDKVHIDASVSIEQSGNDAEAIRASWKKAFKL